MNLTASLNKAAEALRKMKTFNGLPIIEIRVPSEERKRQDAADDGMSPENTESWVNDYVCCGFHIDAYDPFTETNEYQSVEFDWQRLESDFRNWLLPFVGNDESVLPPRLDLDGGDNEIMKVGYGEKAAAEY